MEHEPIKIRASSSQLRDFVDSVLWMDLENEVLVWLEQIRSQLEQETDSHLIARLQGNAEACRYFLQLPQQLITTLEGSA